MIRSIHPHQLGARLMLSTKRQVISYSGWRPVHRWKEEISPNPNFFGETFGPVFTSSTGKVCVNSGGVVFKLLGEKRDLGNPINWDWESNGAPPSHLWEIQLHSMEYLGEVDDSTFAYLVEQWIKSNTPYKKNYWRASWNSYALSIRCVTWMHQYAMRSAIAKERIGNAIAGSLREQIRFLCHNLEVDLGGNHLIKNIKTLLWASEFFHGKESERWRLMGIKLLKEELDKQILADGMHFERSPSYHNQVLADLLDCYRVLGGTKIRLDLKETIIAMARVGIDLAHPDGGPFLFNDGTVSEVKVAEIFEVMSKQGFDLPRKNDNYSYPYAGYSGLFGSNSCLAVKHGKIAPGHLPGHGHGDIFSFEWSIDGERILVDKGVFEYEAGEHRTISRSTLSHNTVNIDGRDQCEFWGSFRSGRQPIVEAEISFVTNQLIMKGSHDGYKRLRGRPIHHREMTVSLELISVIDTVEGGSGQIAQSSLLFHPLCQLDMSDGIVLVDRGRVKLRLEASAPMRILQTEWYPALGESLSTKQILIEYGQIPGCWEFSISRV